MGAEHKPKAQSTGNSASNSTKKIPNYLKFIFGGTAGMTAAAVVQPLDLLKNRMQVSGTSGKKEYKSSFEVAKKVVGNEGFLALYNGLSASLLRQATYTTTRLGLYTWMFEKLSTEQKKPSFAVKAGIGMLAGMAGSFVGTPADLALIRMCADGRLPKHEQRGYKNVVDALVRICREEGAVTLWRGCGPTVMRAMVVNATQLGTYSQAKELVLKSGYVTDGIATHFFASMISGLATAFFSMPVDIAKTRVQNMKVIDGKAQYRNSLDVWAQVMRNEGVFSLWKGFTPYYLRLGPQTVLIFVFLEQLNALYFTHYLGVAKGSSSI